MRSTRANVFAVAASVIAAWALLWGNPVAAETVSPCCDRICENGTSTACNAIVLGGIGANDLSDPANPAVARGCADVELSIPGSNGALPTPAHICYGGTLLDSNPAAANPLITGCVCIFGGDGAPGSCQDENGTPFATMEDCTRHAVESCGANVTVKENDPTCPVNCPAGCDVGQTNCGAGSCVNTSNDPANCGACGHACPTGTACQNGVCTTTCGTGETNCDDHCVDTSSDEANCGSCGNACATGATCENGTCACPTGKTECNGSCVNTQTSKGNCGSCGHACSDGQTCQAGTCACPSGQTDCNGHCVDTTKDPANCGACGTACGCGETCTSGTCATPTCCPAGQTECGGACVDTSSDPANCGECGKACESDETCQAGHCAECTNHSGGGDDTNPGGHGNSNGCDNPHKTHAGKKK